MAIVSIEEKITKSKLLRLIAGTEWDDIEFKEANKQLPKSVYETVSAFSNAHGGWIIFGIAERDDYYEVVGVENIDKLYKDFSTTLKAEHKVNHDIALSEKVISIEGKKVLAIYIPEAFRHHKPIYLNGDIRRTYVRKGGSNQNCSFPTIERFLRDSAEERWDSGI